MPEDPFSTLRNILSPRYREEGPPAYIERFFGQGFFDEEGKAWEPMKTVLDLVVLGYRPVTTLCILTTLVENRNKPYTGRQLGVQLEKRLGLEEGRLTTGRYYDDRIGRLLKILCQLNILEVEKQPNIPREGYRIKKSILPVIEKRIRLFLNGESISPLAESLPFSKLEESQIVKQCSKCKSMIASKDAIYCELCGAPLTISCRKCGKEIPCSWRFCNQCGEPLQIKSGKEDKLSKE
jgi:hypothetical protein